MPSDGNAKMPRRALWTVAICIEPPALDDNDIDPCTKGLNQDRPGLARTVRMTVVDDSESTATMAYAR